MIRPVFNVYEITPDCRTHGRLLRSYKSKERAYAFMNKSIYRYMKQKNVAVAVIYI